MLKVNVSIVTSRFFLHRSLQSFARLLASILAFMVFASSLWMTVPAAASRGMRVTSRVLAWPKFMSGLTWKWAGPDTPYITSFGFGLPALSAEQGAPVLVGSVRKKDLFYEAAYALSLRNLSEASKESEVTLLPEIMKKVLIVGNMMYFVPEISSEPAGMQHLLTSCIIRGTSGTPTPDVKSANCLGTGLYVMGLESVLKYEGIVGFMNAINNNMIHKPVIEADALSAGDLVTLVAVFNTEYVFPKLISPSHLYIHHHEDPAFAGGVLQLIENPIISQSKINAGLDGLMMTVLHTAAVLRIDENGEQRLFGKKGINEDFITTNMTETFGGWYPRLAKPSFHTIEEVKREFASLPPASKVRSDFLRYFYVVMRRPQAQEVSPQPQEESPQSQEESPQSQEESPQSQERRGWGRPPPPPPHSPPRVPPPYGPAPPT